MRWRSLVRPLKRQYFKTLTTLFGDHEGLVAVTPKLGPARGLSLHLNLASGLEDGYYTGEYDHGIANRLSRLIEPDMVVWEFGVFVGYYTVMFAKWVGPAGKVIAFEPNPDNRARAEKNIAANKFPNVRFMPYAIGAPIGETDFVVNSNTNSHLPGVYVGSNLDDYERNVEKRERVMRVRCASPDDLLAEGDIPPPNFIKIDIEGAELLALPHMRRVCNQAKPAICLELHNPECDRAAWEFAAEVGYHIASLDTGGIDNAPE